MLVFLTSSHEHNLLTMDTPAIKIGDIVRHRHILKGTDLSVVSITDDKILVRYANQGVFHSQELFLNEVERFEVDDDELL